jgi:hypothetical protein
MENSISFEMTPALYRRMLSVSAWYRYRVFLIILCLIAISGIVISVFGFLKTGQLKAFYAWAPYFVCVLLWFVYLLWAVPYWMSKSKMNRKQFQRITISHSSDRLTLALANGSRSDIPLTEFVKYQFTDICTFLWLNMTGVIMIPAEAFSNKQTYHEFVNEVISKIEI